MENEKILQDRIKDLELKLCTLLELIKVIINKRKQFDIHPLLAADYRIFCQLVQWLENNNKTSISSFCIAKYVLKNNDTVALKTTLFNLQRLGLIEISHRPAGQFPIIKIKKRNILK